MSNIEACQREMVVKGVGHHVSEGVAPKAEGRRNEQDPEAARKLAMLVEGAGY